MAKYVRIVFTTQHKQTKGTIWYKGNMPSSLFATKIKGLLQIAGLKSQLKINSFKHE